MLVIVHRILIALYLTVPVLALITSIWQSTLFRARIYAAIFLGIVISLILNFASAFMGGENVQWQQLVITAYLATSLLLIIKGFDLLLCNILAHLIFSTRARPGFFRRQIAFAFRLVILFFLGLPYILAAGLTYRIKLQPIATPQTVLNADYQSVSFTTTDGLRIAGWWIPSARPHAFYANRTVLLCPGYSADKSTQLNLVREIVPECYNVLAIDFRGSGQSDGQICTFGDLERRDVLAAVHWLRAEHSSQATKIYGIGETTGAAALIAAATDPGAEGQSIAAVVAYSPVARLDELAKEMAGQIISHSAGTLIRIGLPMATMQTGADLVHFAPADLVSKLWPRPILIIHSQADEIIPWDQGDELYRAASFPKDYYWLDTKSHRQTMLDQTAAAYVLKFLKNAQPVPVI